MKFVVPIVVVLEAKDIVAADIEAAGLMEEIDGRGGIESLGPFPLTPEWDRGGEKTIWWDVAQILERSDV